MKRIVLIVLGLLILILILYIAGFRIIYNPILINDWNAISAVGSWASVIVTAIIAVLLFLYSNVAAPQARLIQYLASINPALTIINLGQKTLCICKISFIFGKYALGRLNAEDSEDMGGVNIDHIMIPAYAIHKFSLPLILLQYQLYDPYDGDEEEFEKTRKALSTYSLKICLHDVTGKKYNIKTDIKFDKYCEILKSEVLYTNDPQGG